MPDPAKRDEPAGLIGGRTAIAYWLAAGAVYVALGVALPPVFLLGFQQSLIYVFLVTVLARVLLRRR